MTTLRDILLRTKATSRYYLRIKGSSVSCEGVCGWYGTYLDVGVIEDGRECYFETPTGRASRPFMTIVEEETCRA